MEKRKEQGRGNGGAGEVSTVIEKRLPGWKQLAQLGINQKGNGAAELEWVSDDARGWLCLPLRGL